MKFKFLSSNNNLCHLKMMENKWKSVIKGKNFREILFLNKQTEIILMIPWLLMLTDIYNKKRSLRSS